MQCSNGLPPIPRKNSCTGRSPYSLKFRQKRRNGSDCALPFRWRRTWDSNPRGCYTLLDFQSSSLAARSILQKYLVISDAHLYYHRNEVNASTFLIFSNYSEVVEKTGLGRSGFSTFCKASQASHVIPYLRTAQRWTPVPYPARPGTCPRLSSRRYCSERVWSAAAHRPER